MRQAFPCFIRPQYQLGVALLSKTNKLNGTSTNTANIVHSLKYPGIYARFASFVALGALACFNILKQ